MRSSSLKPVAERGGAEAELCPCRYYTLSIILGTVALSYGSVPMYKMVCGCEDLLLNQLVLTNNPRFVKRPAGAANQLNLLRMLPSTVILQNTSCQTHLTDVYA